MNAARIWFEHIYEQTANMFEIYVVGSSSDDGYTCSWDVIVVYKQTVNDDLKTFLHKSPSPVMCKVHQILHKTFGANFRWNPY